MLQINCNVSEYGNSTETPCFGRVVIVKVEILLMKYLLVKVAAVALAARPASSFANIDGTHRESSGSAAPRGVDADVVDCVWTANVHDHTDFYEGALSSAVRAVLSPAAVTVYPGTSHGFIDYPTTLFLVLPPTETAAPPTHLRPPRVDVVDVNNIGVDVRTNPGHHNPAVARDLRRKGASASPQIEPLRWTGPPRRGGKRPRSIACFSNTPIQ